MDFFIDFEASDYTQDIISIGCISESGESFSSFIHTNGGISKYITELTGITNEINNTAPSINTVMKNFEKWRRSIAKGSNRLICYGDGDLRFIQHELKCAKTSSLKKSLEYIEHNLVNIEPEVRAHVASKCPIKLIRVYNHYNNSDYTQQHDALDDARILKETYKFIVETEKLVTTPFTTVKQVKVNSNVKQTKISKQSSSKQWEIVGTTFPKMFDVTKVRFTEIQTGHKKEFNTLRDAVTWFQQNTKGHLPNKLKLVEKFLAGKTNYFGYSIKITYC